MLAWDKSIWTTQHVESGNKQQRESRCSAPELRSSPRQRFNAEARIRSERGQSPPTLRVRAGEERQRHGRLTAEGTAAYATQLSFNFCGKSAEDRLARPERRPIATRQNCWPMLSA